MAYGYLSLDTLKEFICERSFGKVDKQHIPLLDKAVISNSLSQYGVHDMEDLIHEIYAVGPNSKQAARFLWPFKLSAPKGWLQVQAPRLLRDEGW